MRKIDTAHIFASPSLTSGTAIVFGALILLFILNSSILSDGGFMTDLLLGQDSSAGLVAVAEQTSYELGELTLGNEFLNKILFFALWMMIGMIVYVSLNTIGSVFGEVSDTAEKMHFIHARKEQIAESFLLRAGIRLAGILGIGIFYLIFARLVLPFSTLASRAWISSLSTPIGWLYGCLGFIVLVLSLHIFVILSRLIAIRPRVFGGWDIYS